MKKFVFELRSLLADHLWFAILYSVSIFVLVGVVMDIYIFHDFSLMTIVQAVIVGIVLGFVFNNVAIQKLKNKKSSN